jgi:hypothetical protein
MGEGSDRRWIALGVSAGVLAIAVAAVLAFGGSGEDDDGAGLDAECIEAWNDDEDSVRIGGHSARLHGADRAWVVRLGESLERTPDSGGRCAVVLSAVGEPEPELGATVLEGKRWRSLIEIGATDEEVAQLQGEATARANVLMRPNGTIAAP